MARFASLCPAGVVQWQDLSFPSSRRGFDSHRPLHSSFYFSLSWRAAKAHEGLQPAWPAVAALPEIPIRQRPAPSGNAGPNPLALVSARIKAAQAKRESRRKRPCRMTAGSPPQGQRVSLAPGPLSGALCDALRLNARRVRAQPLAARRRLQSPASILSSCGGQPQRQAGEFLESAPFESSLPKGMLTCP